MSKYSLIKNCVKSDSQLGAANDLVFAALQAALAEFPSDPIAACGIVTLSAFNALLSWLLGAQPGHQEISEMFREMEANLRAQGYLFRHVDWEKQK